MRIFITGGTGYIGSYVTALLLAEQQEELNLLIRADSIASAHKRLWRALQLHFTWEQFQSLVLRRCHIFLGDITSPKLGLDQEQYETLISTTNSIIHCAASLNRKSEKTCLNVNLRGTLEVIKLARAIQNQHGLRRFSDVSTVAVAGTRENEVVYEEDALDWNRSDYDPYARTKKFCEHMTHELLPDVSTVIFRPSVVLGDSRFPQTTQFDMARAFAILTKLWLVPLPKDSVIDIVPVDFVARCIMTIHQKTKPAHAIYHLSAGTKSLSYGNITDELNRLGHKKITFATFLKNPFVQLINTCANTPKAWGISGSASLLKVFLPYLLYNTVFDNERVIEETGLIPTPFTQYAYPLLKYVQAVDFAYPYKEWQATNTI